MLFVPAEFIIRIGWFRRTGIVANVTLVFRFVRL